jgi:fructose-1,6-bisphosphatase/inositol monophosphatase family enzyme
VPTSIVLEELVDQSHMGGGYFDLGSAAFNLTRIATGQLDAYVDPGRRIVDEVPASEPAFLAAGEGVVCTNFPYDVAAGVLIVHEAGGIATKADGRPLEDHPVVGSSRAHGLAVLASASAELHGLLLAALDRGIGRLRDWYREGA